MARSARLIISIDASEISQVRLAAAQRGVTPNLLARLVLFEHLAKNRVTFGEDWQQGRTAILGLLANGFQTEEDLAGATGLSRQLVRAHLSVLELEGRVTVGKRVSNYSTTATKRGTEIFTLVETQKASS